MPTTISFSFRENLRNELGAVHAEVRAAAVKGVIKGAEHVAGQVRREVLSSMRGRTGALARSWTSRFVGESAADARAEAYSEGEYARIQDEGGTIRPKTRRNLAVPIGAGRNLPVGKWPRDFAPGELTLILRKGRAPLLAKVSYRGKGDKRHETRITPLFILLRSVTLEGQHYTDRAAAASEEGVALIVQDAIDDVLVGAT